MIKRKARMISCGIVCILMAVVFLSGCAEKIVNERSGDVEIKVSATLSSGLFSEQLGMGLLTVTAPDFEEPIMTHLEFVGGFFVGEVVVPAGRSRVFEITVYNEAGDVIYKGSTMSDIKPDIAVEFVIDLYPQVPMLKVSPAFQAVPQGSHFSMDVKVYNLLNLNTAEIIITYPEFAIFPPDSIVLNSALGATVRSYILNLDILGGYAFGIQETNETAALVNDSGYANLATLYFTSNYIDPEIDTVFIGIGPWNLIDNRGDTIANSDVVGWGSEIEVYRPSFYAVGYWQLNEMSGDTAYDVSGNMLHGTAVGTLIDEGRWGLARMFNGVSDYIEVPDNDLLDINEAITISMWVKVDALEQQGVLFSKAIPGGDINYQILFSRSAVTVEDYLGFQFGPPPANTYQATANFRDGLWHHLAIAFVFGDPLSAQWFIDGLVVQGNWVTGVGDAIPAVNTYGLQMGRQLTDPGDYFHGGLDQISISNIALDAPQIGSLITSFRAGTGRKGQD